MHAANRNNRGVVLLVTLAVMVVLVAIAVEVNRRSRAHTIRAVVLKERTTLRSMAVSGIVAAEQMLMEDLQKGDTDHLREAWARKAMVDRYLRAFAFPEGFVQVHIEDERARLQIHALLESPGGSKVRVLQMEIWQRLLDDLLSGQPKTAHRHPVAVVNSLIDWLDAHDDEAVTGVSGAENDYYRRLQKPYACRNGAVARLGELLAVKGITADLFMGRGNRLGLRHLATVYAPAARKGMAPWDGRININTASWPVVRSLLPEDAMHVLEAIYDHRQARSSDEYINDISKDAWYTDVPGFGTLDESYKKNFQSVVTTSSNIFRVIARAQLNGRRHWIEAVIIRYSQPDGSFNCRRIGWREDIFRTHGEDLFRD